MGEISDQAEGVADPDDAIDPYTIQTDGVREAPKTLTGRFKSLGPGIVVSGSIVGSGEILLTAGLGAAVGFVLLWWVLFSCWIKSIVQAELARYVITSGDTYLRALNRLPGKMKFPGRRGKAVSWPIWLGFVGLVPGLLTSGGIIGGAGQALGLLIPGIDGAWATIVAAAVVMLILGSGAYGRFEKVMLVMVMSFTFATILSALLMQTTEYQATLGDIASGFQFDFPLEHAALAIAMYGATGVASSEISAYQYWCVEKGYPSFIGADHTAPGWVERAKGWIRVVQTDVWVTLVILTFATLSFYFLGAGVLHRIGATPSGRETIDILSNMYTTTLGVWSFWLFSFGAFCILFSTVLSGIGAGSRSFPDLLVTLGFIDRQNLERRKKWIRGYIIAMPIISTVIYLSYQEPIALVIFGATFGAFMLPVQSFMTVYMQRKRMDPRVRPGPWTRGAVVVVFLIQAILSAFIIWNIFFGF